MGLNTYVSSAHPLFSCILMSPTHVHLIRTLRYICRCKIMHTHIQGYSGVVPENSDLFIPVGHLITKGNIDPLKP